MFGLNTLKGSIHVTDLDVECPVLNCTHTVTRQRKVFRREEQFRCPLHRIYISPSTFEYSSPSDNFLQGDRDELQLFNSIRKVKRECRLARDNSEDAVTWNVFRFLERNNLLASYLESITGIKTSVAKVIYWSYCQNTGAGWPLLNVARQEFGEEIRTGSEPDIIITTDCSLFFIEAKMNAGNHTIPRNASATRKYLTGGDQWYAKVFRQDYESIAIAKRKYELLRFWLLGSWIAKQMGVSFHLVSLVLGRKDQDVEKAFAPLINEIDERRFVRSTWESIHDYIVHSAADAASSAEMIAYFRNKCLGYDSRYRLIKAFTV